MKSSTWSTSPSRALKWARSPTSCAVDDESRCTRSDNTWTRTLAVLAPGVAVEPLRAKLHATSRAFEEERAKGFTGMTREAIVKFLDQKVVLEPASAGASGLQKDYGRLLVASSAWRWCCSSRAADVA